MWTLFLLSIYIHQDMQANKQANKWARKTISSFFWLESINIDKLSIFNQQWKPIRWETYVKETYFIINFMYKYSNMRDFLLFFFKEQKKQRSTERNLITKKWTLQRRYERNVLRWTAARAWGCCKIYLYNIRSEVKDDVPTDAMHRSDRKKK